MAFVPKKKTKYRDVNFEPELVPFIDMLVVCCCFLLMSASLLQTAVIEISLPSAAAPGSASSSPQPQAGELNLSLIITDEGLRIGGSGAILPLIPKKGAGYDWDKLTKNLKDIKKQFPNQNSMIIISEPEIIYDNIIQAMDRCVMEGFPDISLSGQIQQ